MNRMLKANDDAQDERRATGDEGALAPAPSLDTRHA